MTLLTQFLFTFWLVGALACAFFTIEELYTDGCTYPPVYVGALILAIMWPLALVVVLLLCALIYILGRDE